MEAVETTMDVVGLTAFLEIAFIDFTISELWSPVFWAALWKIIVANIVLSGDNAVVIALACRNLSDKYRSRAIFFGSAGAVVLLWIGVKMVAQEEDTANIKAHENLWAAIWTIIVADAVMSLDNAIAIAAAAKGNFTLIVIGLVISIPIIVFGATLISKLLDRFHWLGMVGAALIGWIAGEVMAGDGRRDVVGADGKLVETIEPGTIAAWLDAHLPHAELVAAIVGALFVVGLGLLLARRKARPHSQG